MLSATGIDLTDTKVAVVCREPIALGKSVAIANKSVF